MGDPSSHQDITISPSMLPSGDNVVFSDSSFFKHNARLPAPSLVREEAAKPKDLPGRWAHKPWAVPFFSMHLIVKYGTTLSIAEGQCMWAIRSTLGQQVPVPEVYGWCKDGKEVFIYMQLIEGQTLEDAWDTLAQTERASIHYELRRIVKSLRSLRQPLGDSFIGELDIACIVTFQTRLTKFVRQYRSSAVARLHVRGLRKTRRPLSYCQRLQRLFYGTIMDG
jgi:hypothetical protein